MVDQPAAGLRGAIVWAIVCYVPEAPFRLWLGDGNPAGGIASAHEFAQQVRQQGLDAEQTFLVEGKLRPVLLMQDRPRRALREIVDERLEGLGG